MRDNLPIGANDDILAPYNEPDLLDKEVEVVFVVTKTMLTKDLGDKHREEEYIEEELEKLKDKIRKIGLEIQDCYID